MKKQIVDDWVIVRRPFFNVISVASPIVGSTVAAILFANGGNYYGWQLSTAVVTLLVTFLGGEALAVVAYFRSERLWGLTLLGFLLNVPVPLALILLATGTIEQVANFFFPI